MESVFRIGKDEAERKLHKYWRVLMKTEEQPNVHGVGKSKPCPHKDYRAHWSTYFFCARSAAHPGGGRYGPAGLLNCWISHFTACNLDFASSPNSSTHSSSDQKVPQFFFLNQYQSRTFSPLLKKSPKTGKQYFGSPPSHQTLHVQFPVLFV